MNIEVGEKVSLYVEEETALGFIVVINDEHDGLLYRNEIFQDIEVDSEVEGYIKNIREDGKIDVSLRPQGFRNVIDSDVDTLLEKLQQKGFLMLTDKSTPESIKFHLQMSKKAFKRAIGSLYKQKMILLKEDRIELIK